MKTCPPAVRPSPFFLLVLLSLALAKVAMASEEIGFIETFALADDRAGALEQLIPGTEEYFYFHALHAQNSGEPKKVKQLLEPWIKRYGETQRVWEIRHRQALLDYDKDPKKSLDYLRHHLGLSFNHQQQKLNAKPNFPTTLDRKRVSWEAFLAEAFRRSNTTSMVKDSGLDRILRSDVDLPEKRRRDLLNRLRYPDYPRLVGLIAADLRTKESRGFGEFQIHRNLLPGQLDELLGLRSQLIHDTNFVHTRIQKLHPGADVDWRRDAAERGAYLQRIREFVQTLSPSFNSLKAHSLCQLLRHHQGQGNYPRDLFLAYIKLPRPMPYVEPRYLADADRRRYQVDLNADFQAVTRCPVIGNDEPLVRDFLLHFFVEDGSIEAYEPFLRDTWLKPLFAEAKLTNGVGDAERWFSMLTPAQVQALKDRVDIEFAPGNAEQFDPADEVKLDVLLKNVGKLMVKVYEINALNFFLDQKRDLNTDLNLDGLIANREQSFEYEEVPIRRVKRTFTFESLNDSRGAWVIEFIGNGMSSRALVRKGRLQYLSHVTPAGTAITVLDETNRPARKPGVWFGGSQYTPDPKTGVILVPFSNQPGNQPMVLTDGDFATLEWLEVPAENYELTAGIHVDREGLLPGKEVEIAVRPVLTLNGRSAGVSVLEEVKLVIRSTDLEGIESVNEVESFELFDDRESLHTIRVPERLTRLNVALVAKVARLSAGGEKADLMTWGEFVLNEVDQSEHVADSHLSRIGGEYVLEVLGKTGEPLEDRAVNVQVQHRDFQKALQFSLKTNERGRVGLGALDGCASITVNGNGLPGRHFSLAEERNFVRSSAHGKAGESIQIPLPDKDGKLTPSDLALLETRAGAFVSDHFGKVTRNGGLLELKGLEPGDYELYLRRPEEKITVRVTEADNEAKGYLLSRFRHLEVKNPTPLQIASVDPGDETVRIQLQNADEFTRVHLVATRFLPEFPLEGYLSEMDGAEPVTIDRGSSESLYVSGRDIGEEYRYILERRAAKKFPGTMVVQPGILLNPWALQDTETAVDDAEAGEAYEKSREAKKSSRAAMKKGKPKGEPDAFGGGGPMSSNLNFLLRQAPIAYNLAPDENGVVTLKRTDLGDRQHLHVLAVNAENTAYRQVSLPEGEGTGIRDLRLTRNLDPAKRFAQIRKVTMLGKGETLKIPDLRSSELETYDTLAEVYTALSGVNENETLAEFAFILQWPGLEEARKRELYSKYACHELNFFLSRRDEDFFRTVIQPYLRNKKDKTFLDDYLIGAELAPYLEPWRHGRLNVVERILLARRLGEEETGATARHVGELFDLLPVDIEQRTWFFRSALRGLRMKGIYGEMGGGGGAGAGAADPFAAPAGSEGRETATRLGGKAGMRQLADMVTLPEAKHEGTPMSVVLERPAAAEAEEQVNALSSLARRKNEESAKKISLGLEGVDKEALLDLRKRQRALFRKLESTKEWAENNYYHLPIAQQIADLITVNGFWRDFATWDGKGGFFSREFPSASNSFAEMMLALSVLDVPFQAGKHDLTIEENVLTLAAKSPVIVFHEEVEETPVAEERPPILISQNFFRASDRYQHVGNERTDKFVTEEFLTGVLYGCQVVVTNPISSTQKLDLLLQIPRGALPAMGSDYTETRHARLDPFTTQKVEYYFYFPADSGEGKYPHYPVHVSMGEKAIAWAAPFAFKVVDQLSTLDKASWDYLSQFGTEQQVIDFLNRNNVHRLDLGRVAWRCRESADFFRKVVSLLENRHWFDQTLWSYGLFHNHTPVARQYLLHRDDFLQKCGGPLECSLVAIEPVERHWYQHLEYQPLVNARAHQLGRDRKILNDRFRAQYQATMKTLSYRPEFDDQDRLTVAYYLFLQDRIEDGLDWLGRVKAGNVETRLQHDYLQAYAALYREESAEAARIAEAHLDYPVDRWRERFVQIAEQIKEIEGGVPRMTDEEDREQQQDALAASEPGFELQTEGQRVDLTYRNLERVRLNYYEMDLEFLFSSNPFVTEDSSRFSFIRPNVTLLKDLPADGEKFSFTIPEQFANKNVLVEVVGAGQKKAAAVYANALDLQVTENYGRLQVRHTETGRPLSKVYVKVYGRFSDGNVRFFKDGYTDLRGKFDYVSLNTNEIDKVERLSLLIMSEDEGALVKEVGVPKR